MINVLEQVAFAKTQLSYSIDYFNSRCSELKVKGLSVESAFRYIVSLGVTNCNDIMMFSNYCEANGKLYQLHILAKMAGE